MLVTFFNQSFSNYCLMRLQNVSLLSNDGGKVLATTVSSDSTITGTVGAAIMQNVPINYLDMNKALLVATSLYKGLLKQTVGVNDCWLLALIVVDVNT